MTKSIFDKTIGELSAETVAATIRGDKSPPKVTDVAADIERQNAEAARGVREGIEAGSNRAKRTPGMPVHKVRIPKPTYSTPVPRKVTVVKDSS